jgi:hypothetical protein
MGLPARDEARNWVGWTVVDREGAEVGACTAVLADESTGLPEWMYVEVDGASAVVPAVDADGSEGRITVTVTRAQVSGAPSVGGRELTQAQEADLYRHYGIDASREASESLLPAAATDTAAAGPVDTPAAAATDTPATPAADTPAAAATDTPAGGGRGPVVAAVALAATAGLAVAAARRRRPTGRQSLPRPLWSRRPWAPQPPSRAELVAGQVLAVSARAREGARHAGRAAGPMAAAAAESARHRALLAGEGARHVIRTAAPLAVAAAESARHRAMLAGEGTRHVIRTAAPLAVAAAESARHRAVLAGEGARHLRRTAAPLAVAAAESARHRASLGAEQLRHAARLASSAAGTWVRARA